MSDPIGYKDAGVDIDAANLATERIRKLAKTTFNENVLSDIGSFGGMFNGSFAEVREPILVSSCDGVGTKVKIAFATGGHESIGYDLVTASVNDILVQGAKPLFFMDYIATGKLSPDVIAKIIEGVVRACRESNCALLGGETAEMPGIYADEEYDLAGFVVGVVDRRKVISGSRITEGDVVIGLPSLGLHTNGYSLARKLLLDVAGYQIDSHVEELGCTLGEELMKPHKNYLPPIERLIDHEGVIKGMAHITGGGLVENIPRILPRNVDVLLREGSWPMPPVFDLMQKIGNVPRAEMLRTFNLGIGMVLIVNPKFQQFVEDQLNFSREKFYIIGEVTDGERKVRFA
ncbi:MAG: phosphoribosylformylglycinamidine cyclo-ligase [Blastocatellia bacterium]|nr:phosphoribosylformylglycinamidine cyclo-ligase [Blastocatellia bacterium]